MAQRAVHFVVLSRRSELGGRPEYGLPDGLIEVGRNRARRPMSRRRDARKRDRIVRVRTCRDASSCKCDLLHRHVELRRRNFCEPVAQSQCGEPRGTGHGRCESAGIIARRDRPTVLRGVHFGDNPDILRLQSERIRDHLRKHGPMALSLRRRGDLD